MRAFAACLLVPLIAVYAMNLSLDAGGLRTSAQIVKLAAAQAPGDVIVSPTQFDQRAWVKARLERADGCPDILVLGSSTVGEVDSAMFPGHSVLNAFLAGPMVEDFEAVTAILRRTHCHPKMIVAGADPFWLGNAGVNDRRWMGLLDDYLAFDPARNALGTETLRANVAWAGFEERLNFTTSRESVRLMLARLRGQRNAEPRLMHATPEAICAASASKDLYLRAPDGHYASCYRASESERREVASNYLKTNMHSMAEWREVAWDRIARFGKLVAEWQGDTDRVVLLATPYNPITYSLLLSDRRLSQHLGELDAALAEMARAPGGKVTYLNLRDPARAGCPEAWFEDSHHAARECVQRYASEVSALLGK